MSDSYPDDESAILSISSRHRSRKAINPMSRASKRFTALLISVGLAVTGLTLFSAYPSQPGVVILLTWFYMCGNVAGIYQGRVGFDDEPRNQVKS